jgi:hypothetical protein
VAELARLEGAKALVFGPSGFGRAVVAALAEAGAAVCIATLTAERAEDFAANSIANEVWALARRGRAIAIDAAGAGEVKRAVREAEAELGGLTLIVVNADERLGATLPAGKTAARLIAEVAAAAPESSRTIVVGADRDELAALPEAQFALAAAPDTERERLVAALVEIAAAGAPDGHERSVADQI